MSWVLELTPDQAYEKARRTVVDGCAEDVVDILDQTSLDISARGLARRGLVLEAIHELAADRLMPDGLYENITKHLEWEAMSRLTTERKSYDRRESKSS